MLFFVPIVTYPQLEKYDELIFPDFGADVKKFLGAILTFPVSSR